MSYIVIAIGGALGAVLRYLIAGFFSKHICSSFPCGILFVNVIGSFLITFFMTFFTFSAIDPLYRLFFVVGFLGSFTTLSSITYDTIFLLKSGDYFRAFLNLFLNFFLSLFAGFGGLVIGKILFIKGS